MKDSWLTPDGKIIEVGDFQHNEYASEYLSRIEILGGDIDLTKPMRNTINPTMNEKQIKCTKMWLLK